MLLLHLALFVFAATQSTMAFPRPEQNEVNGHVAQSEDNAEAVRIIEDNNLRDFCGQMLEAGESPVATVTTTVPASITTSSQTISPVAIAVISSGTHVETITVSQPAAEVTNTITVSSIPGPGAGGVHSTPRDILNQIRTQIRPDVWSDISRHMVSESSGTASRKAELFQDDDTKRKKVDANDNNYIQCNMNRVSHTSGGTSIVASINYSKNNGKMEAGYAINGVKVPQGLYPYQAPAIAAACRQVLKKGNTSASIHTPETTSAAVVAPRAMGSRTLTVTVTNATAPALSTTYETSTIAGVSTLSSTTYTIPHATTTTTTTSTNSSETRTVNIFVLVSTITSVSGGGTAIGTASPIPSVTTTTSVPPALSNTTTTVSTATAAATS